MLASEQRYLAEIILTQLTIKVPNFGPKNSNFACKSQIFRISFQKMLRSLGLGLGLETFAKFLRVSVSKNLVSEKKSRFRFQKNLVSEKSLGFGEFGLGRKVSVSVSEKFGVGKKYRFRFRFQKIWYRKKSLGIGFGKIFGIVIQWWRPCFLKSRAESHANFCHYHYLVPLNVISIIFKCQSKV